MFLSKNGMTTYASKKKQIYNTTTGRQPKGCRYFLSHPLGPTALQKMQGTHSNKKPDLDSLVWLLLKDLRLLNYCLVEQPNFSQRISCSTILKNKSIPDSENILALSNSPTFFNAILSCSASACANRSRSYEKPTREQLSAILSMPSIYQSQMRVALLTNTSSPDQHSSSALPATAAKPNKRTQARICNFMPITSLVEPTNLFHSKSFNNASERLHYYDTPHYPMITLLNL
jgi:hypothetical protein